VQPGQVRQPLAVGATQAGACERRRRSLEIVMAKYGQEQTRVVVSSGAHPSTHRIVPETFRAPGSCAPRPCAPMQFATRASARSTLSR